MFYLHAIILAIVQGFTEFLPVSSSGHLVILHNILKFNLAQSLAFDVALHLGTGVALVVYFWKDIKVYLNDFWKLCLRDASAKKENLDVFFKIIVASIPAIIIGLLLEDLIEGSLRKPIVVIVCLILGGLIFFLIEKVKTSKKFAQLSFGQAIYIGFAQALALIPGVSRSGITIIAGMSTKLKRAEAAKFAFLMGIPIILGAGLYKFLTIDLMLLDNNELIAFVLGFIVSFLVGWLVIKFLMKFLVNNKLYVFGIYRILLALVLIVIFYII